MREQELRLAAEREVILLRETAADLHRILADPDEARRYFAVVERAEIEENEFNLNLPRYVDTFEPEEVVPLDRAAVNLKNSVDASNQTLASLKTVLAGLNIEWGGNA